MIRAACVAFAAASILCCPAHAQASDIPRTPEGRPDFQGVWDRHMQTPLERPAGIAGAAVAKDDARRIAIQLMEARVPVIGGTPLYRIPGQILNEVRGEFRTSMVIEPADGKLPYTPEGQALATAARNMVGPPAENPEQRRTQERCIAGSGRTPFNIMPELMLSRIVQTPGSLAVQTEHNGDMRIIPIGRTRGASGVVSWMGDSTARWDGDTLVVETVNLRDDLTVLPIVRRQSKVTEWFALAGADELNYRFTVEDPFIYAKPWKAEFSMKRSAAPIFENACHEGNYALTNILRGARETERRAAAKAVKP